MSLSCACRRPTVLVYVILCTFPCFAVVTVSSKVTALKAPVAERLLEEPFLLFPARFRHRLLLSSPLKRVVQSAAITQRVMADMAHCTAEGGKDPHKSRLCGCLNTLKRGGTLAPVRIGKKIYVRSHKTGVWFSGWSVTQ